MAIGPSSPATSDAATVTAPSPAHAAQAVRTAPEPPQPPAAECERQTARGDRHQRPCHRRERHRPHRGVARRPRTGPEAQHRARDHPDRQPQQRSQPEAPPLHQAPSLHPRAVSSFPSPISPLSMFGDFQRSSRAPVGRSRASRERARRHRHPEGPRHDELHLCRHRGARHTAGRDPRHDEDGLRRPAGTLHPGARTGPTPRSPEVRLPACGRSTCRGRGTTGTGGRTAACCPRPSSPPAWTSPHVCIPPGTDARRRFGSCMPGTRRSSSALPSTVPSMRSLPGPPMAR